MKPIKKLSPGRERFRALGLCIACGSKRPCKHCCKRASEWLRKKAKKWKRNGLCTRCGGKRPCLKCQKLGREKHEKVRLEALAHYGKGGKILCCWPGCSIIDPDMLTIDHIEDDGAIMRKKIGSGPICPYLRKRNWPKGFQTLCGSHQWKKEKMRRQAVQIARKEA